MNGNGSSQHQPLSATADLNDLPVSPQALVALIDACGQPTVDFGKLATIICHEPVLFTRIIAVAASRDSLDADQFEHPERLLAGLGSDCIRTIAVTAAVNYFFAPPEPEIRKALERYTQQARTTAVLASLIAEAAGYPCLREAWFAGLTHNIGQLLLLTRHPDDYTETYLSASSARELYQFEREWFGQSGIEKGTELLQSITVDSFLADALLCQLEPTASLQDSPALISILNLACRLGSRRNGTVDNEIQNATAQLGLSEQDIEQIDNRAEQQLRDLNLQCSISAVAGEPTSLSNQAVFRQLKNSVRGFATAWGLSQQQLGISGPETSWQRALSNIDLLFGLNRAIALEHDEETATLRGIATGRGSDARLQQLKIRVAPGRSLVAESVLRGHILDADRHDEALSASIIDRQLLRMLRTETFLCLPLHHQGLKFGVIVVGMPRRQQQSLRQHQQPLLKQFLQAAGTEMARRRESELLCQQSLEGQRSQQLNAIHKLAHEASNPLSIIKNYTQILERSVGDNDRISEQFTIIREEIDRVATIIQQMRDVNAPVDVTDGLVNINQLISDQVSVFRDSIFGPARIDCLLDLDNSLEPIRSHGLSLKQVLTNLLKNAAEAMPNGGRVTVKTRNNVNFNGKIYVELTLADTGTGITPEVFEKAFTPLKTTKGSEHSGIGLSIVSSLVANLNGYISCRNSEGGGAEFSILLPFIRSA